MGVILTGTAGLCLWIVMWALNVKAFDGILVTSLMVLVALGCKTLVTGYFHRHE
jgi:hypothetical protein